MSDTWRETRVAIRRLRAALHEADEDTRWNFGFWLVGLALMAGAIVMQFGWLGAIFCGGAVLCFSGANAMRS